MKLKAIAMSCLVALGSSVYATNNHVHPEDKSAVVPGAPAVKANFAGYCEIEVINQSRRDVWVSGTFDDGVPLDPFAIYSYESPHYISLYYYGYCHYGMDLYIDSASGYPLYTAYTKGGTTVRIVPYLKDNAKVELSKH